MSVNWSNAVSEMSNHVVKVEAGPTYGSGFLIPSPVKKDGHVSILTAWHVVKDAYERMLPIKITQFSTGRFDVVIPMASTVMFAQDRDQAIVHFDSQQLTPPIEMTFLKKDMHYKPGVKIGWLGLPNIAPETVCFFKGCISAYIESREVYLVDGVSIHGVSGGPVFHVGDDDKIVVAGVVTNYYPNNQNGATLPGLAGFQTINPLMKLYGEQETGRTK